MPKRIFITGQIPEVGIRMLREKGYIVDVYQKDKILKQKQTISLLKKKSYDAVLTLLTDSINAKVFDAVPGIRLYANYATGFDNIDISEAHKRGITITNAPAELTSEAVAEHTIALMLALVTRIVEADNYVRRGKYKGWRPMNLIGTDLAHKTIGLIGAGRIGERVAQYSKCLGMKIIYTDIIRNSNLEAIHGAIYYTSIDEVLKAADVVSLHVPLLESTRHLINEARLKLMKPTSFLINTSRGPVIDEVALERALRRRTIAGAALDVFEFEPRTVSGLTNLPNSILTPHIASASSGARDQMAVLAAQNIIDFLEGRVPKNIVHP